MIISSNRLFHAILGLTALFVAGVAAFFSIRGIGMLFAGAAISSMVMATALELGKVVATSFLYRFWKQTSKWLKTYLIAAVIVLVGITSLGIFGWLSGAYQSSAHEFENIARQESVITEQKAGVIAQVEVSKKRISDLTQLRASQEQRMNDALNNQSLSRNPTALRQIQEQNIEIIKQTTSEMAEEQKRYNQLWNDSLGYDKKIFEIKNQSATSKDIITFKFVSDAIGWDLTTTVKWFIVVIISVFDPLAICLILAYNTAVFGTRKDLVITQPKTPTIDEVRNIVVEQVPHEEVIQPDGHGNSEVTIPVPLVPDPTPTPTETQTAVSPTPIPTKVPTEGNLREYEYFSAPTR